MSVVAAPTFETGSSPLVASRYELLNSHIYSCDERTVAKLFFYYSAMNAGKSTVLLQSSYNYRERGMHTLLLIPEIDTRDGEGFIYSRIGLRAEATMFSPVDDLMQLTTEANQSMPVDCVLVDEAQFLARKQVGQLCDVADELNIPVLTYGLRTDFRGDLFEGSQSLLAWADTINEIKTICHCGRKATMVLRIGPDGKAVKEGSQVEVGGNERYLSVCRRHHKEGIATRPNRQLPFDES